MNASFQVSPVALKVSPCTILGGDRAAESRSFCPHSVDALADTFTAPHRPAACHHGTLPHEHLPRRLSVNPL